MKLASIALTTLGAVGLLLCSMLGGTMGAILGLICGVLTLPYLAFLLIPEGEQ